MLDRPGDAIRRTAVEVPRAPGSTALVTGATGFLGQWVVRRLQGAGRRVVALTRPGRTDCPQPVREVIRESVDLRHVDGIRDVLDRHGVESVYHLAGDSTIHASRSDPTTTFSTNIEGTWSLLEACRLTPAVRSIVVASSDKAYGSSGDLPYVEDTPLLGRGPYEVSKACGDLIAQSYGVHFGVPVVVVRSGNFYGGGDLNWSRLVPGVLRAAFQGHPVQLRSDGSAVRDYVYVEDAADAFFAIESATQLRPDLRGSAFNVSTRNVKSTLGFISELLEEVGSETPVVLGEPNADEIAEQWLDPSRLEQVLGWSAATPPRSALQRTAAWYRDHVTGGSSADALVTGAHQLQTGLSKGR